MVHVTGIWLAATSLAALENHTPTALCIFSAVRAVMLVCSALYNTLWWTYLGSFLLWLDTTAIYGMILGTEVSFIAAVTASKTHFILLVAASSCAAGGVGCNLYLNWPWPCWRLPARRVLWKHTILYSYLLLASLSVLLLPSLLSHVHCLSFFVAGHAVYLAGLVFHKNSSWRFQRGVWHLCVLAGAQLHYQALVLLH